MGGGIEAYSRTDTISIECVRTHRIKLKSLDKHSTLNSDVYEFQILL